MYVSYPARYGHKRERDRQTEEEWKSVIEHVISRNFQMWYALFSNPMESTFIETSIVHAIYSTILLIYNVKHRKYVDYVIGNTKLFLQLLRPLSFIPIGHRWMNSVRKPELSHCDIAFFPMPKQSFIPLTSQWPQLLPFESGGSIFLAICETLKNPIFSPGQCEQIRIFRYKQARWWNIVDEKRKEKPQVNLIKRSFNSFSPVVPFF